MKEIKITKQLEFIINTLQKYHFDKDSLKMKKTLLEKGAINERLSKYSTIEIIEVNIEESYIVINPLIQNYKKVKVFKDRFDLLNK